MPGSRHLPGATPKENRMYEHILDEGRERYGDRAKEVAARTVNKRRAAKKKSLKLYLKRDR